MRSVRIQASGALRDFAAGAGALTVEFELPVGLRDLVQSTGIPHVEVGSVAVNGEPAPWDRRIDDGDQIRLQARYPLNEPPAAVRFVADVHLARLARHLRLFGFDTVWDPDLDDPDLVETTLTEGRVLLTRDLGLLMRSRLEDGTFVRATDPREQLAEILQRFALRSLVAPFTRCLECNGQLVDVPNDVASSQVPESVADRHDRYTGCQDCDRIYWPGSHHDRMTTLIDEITTELAEGPG